MLKMFHNVFRKYIPIIATAVIRTIFFLIIARLSVHYKQMLLFFLECSIVQSQEKEDEGKMHVKKEKYKRKNGGGGTGDEK